MSKKGEFGEPVYVIRGDHGAELEAECFIPYPSLMERAATCVNALDGLEPEKLGALIEVAQEAVLELDGSSHGYLLEDLQKALDELGVTRG